MKTTKLMTGIVAVFGLLAMGCATSQFDLNSDPMSGDDYQSMAVVVEADWDAPASRDSDASGNGRYLVVAGSENGVLILDAMTGDVVREFETEYRNVMVNYSPSGKLVAACDSRGVMRIWNVQSGELVSERQTSPAQG